jgi:hypothetical protein
MSWMSEIATMIESAAEYGVTLEVGDFRRSGNTLLLDGMPADQWMDAMFEGAESFFPDTLSEMET